MRPNKRKRSAIKQFTKNYLFGECSKVKSVIDLKTKKGNKKWLLKKK